MKHYIFALVIITLFLSPVQVWGKTYYLDGTLGSNCTGTYSTASRNCSGSAGDAYNSLAGAITALVGGDTLYIRSGTYIRTTNDISIGSLAVGPSGTSGAHTIVQAYTGEQPIICTETGRCQYNPNPGDESVTVCTGAGGQGGAACYYPNPAISVGGAYIDVIGLKTFGQVLIGAGNNILIEGNDIGGGGPHLNQGQAIIINNTSSTHALTIRSNYIHHSAWGESDLNGSALMGYNFSAIIENNEFYDNWGCDVKTKDASGQTGRTTIVRNNFFRPSSIFANSYGFCGFSQDSEVDYVYIHNNIFLQKSTAIGWEGSAAIETIAYNNTFVNNGREIFDWTGGPTINVFNNLNYHSTASQNYYDIQASPLSELNSNYNLFYSTASASWRNLDLDRGSTLSAWQSYSGKDGASVSVDPGFINASGTSAVDFKRSSYAGDVSGSSYSNMTGAYITGNEVIGPTTIAPPPSPTPNRPSVLVVE